MQENCVQLNYTLDLLGDKRITFVIVAHRTESREKRLIEPAFYEANCLAGAIPEGVHYELEVLQPQWSANERQNIHVHEVPDTGRCFVCWTGSLPTVKDVKALLHTWCVGTAYALQTGNDFGPEYGRDPSSFLRRMQDEHGISMVDFSEQEINPSPRAGIESIRDHDPLLDGYLKAMRGGK